ncbi:hypothetical protein, partial [Staphylococcus aureus]|uniref:hypothetical protein n=1 Tax=Staphylococcus aureus TaxID=1280 RepID=UPI00210E5305
EVDSSFLEDILIVYSSKTLPNKEEASSFYDDASLNKVLLEEVFVVSCGVLNIAMICDLLVFFNHFIWNFCIHISIFSYGNPKNP